MAKQVLVTTGATVTFVKLINYVLDLQFILEIKSLHYNRLVVQYGNSDASRDLILSLLSKLETSKPIKKSKDGTIDANIRDIDVQCIKFDSNFVENYTLKSDLIISHAGTGSILDTLRCNKKLLVVINEDLLDNHQLDIAKAFEQLGVLCYHEGSYYDFLKLVQKVSKSKFKELSQPNGSLVENIIFSEL